MSQIFYLLSTDEETGVRNLVVFTPGAGTESASSESHSNFDAILEAVVSGDDLEDVLDMFDRSEAVRKHFKSLSDRVTVANGQLYLDGDVVDNALTKQVVAFLDEGLLDWQPLVDFFEKVQSNPEPHSREQLFEWLNHHDFTIDRGGDIIAYKGLTEDYKSIQSGPGIVNGEEVNGQLDNTPGNVVEIARSYVHHDPSAGCSTGLHVGTHAFADNFGHGVCVKVKVNPRDVVSVPTDSNAQKVRCCRYQVLEAVTEKVASAYDGPEAEEPDDWDYDGYGDY